MLNATLRELHKAFQQASQARDPWARLVTLTPILHLRRVGDRLPIPVNCDPRAKELAQLRGLGAVRPGAGCRHRPMMTLLPPHHGSPKESGCVPITGLQHHERKLWKPITQCEAKYTSLGHEMHILAHCVKGITVGHEHCVRSVFLRTFGYAACSQIGHIVTDSILSSMTVRAGAWSSMLILEGQENSPSKSTGQVESRQWSPTD